MQKFIESQSAAESAVKKEMHSDLMATLKGLGPSRDEKISAKLRMLTEMSTHLSTLDANDVTRPLYQAQVELMMGDIRQLQAERSGM